MGEKTPTCDPLTVFKIQNFILKRRGKHQIERRTATESPIIITIPFTHRLVREQLWLFRISLRLCWLPTILLGWKQRKFTQLKETKGLIISLYWYGSKDHHFILLPGHILYRKPGGSQDSLYRGQIQTLLQCCREPYHQIPLVITIQKKYSLTYLPLKNQNSLPYVRCFVTMVTQKNG